MNCAALDCHYPAIHRAWVKLSDVLSIEIGLCAWHERARQAGSRQGS